MTGFASLIDQHQSIEILAAILQKGTIPHALLFTGIEGIGKRTAAMTFAMACNCSDIGNTSADTYSDAPNQDTWQGRLAQVEPCGKCRSCRKIISNSHPDIIQIRPTGPYIRIDQIRKLRADLSMKPYEAKNRVVIISDAQRMNPEAGNALLKMLEEPPDKTFLVLTATATTDLLPTIVSRCRHIRFRPISTSRLAAKLSKDHGIDPDHAHCLSILADGSLSKADAFHRKNWMNRRDWLIRAGGILAQGPARQQSITEQFAVARDLSRDRELAVEALSVLKTVFRDILVCRFQSVDIFNPDLSHKIEHVAARMDEESAMAGIRAIDAAQKNILSNSNARLTLEALFLTLAKEMEMN
ncbi:MAG: DNA polymerase III subunit delta' [Deltaproteobacteria bacterium]|nr:DNA polymerase III subunit delta' [Deltaproteobacteria bacterium]